jgi:hypothetical protein
VPHLFASRLGSEAAAGERLSEQQGARTGIRSHQVRYGSACYGEYLIATYCVEAGATNGGRCQGNQELLQAESGAVMNNANCNKTQHSPPTLPPVIAAAAAFVRHGFPKNWFRESNGVVKFIVISLGDVFPSSLKGKVLYWQFYDFYSITFKFYVVFSLSDCR